VNANVWFEAEADAEYRAAGRWYEKRRLGLDAALTQIVRLPKAGAPINQLPSDLPVRRAPVKQVPYHFSTRLILGMDRQR